MDSLTHIVLGACVAEAVTAKGSRRVLVLGAAAQSLPDLDVVAGIWLDPVSDLLAHRGITHSFLSVVLLAPMLGWLTDRFIMPQVATFRKWTLLFFVELFVHVFLDAFNAYGTGWFEPFSSFRVSFNAVFVADPFLVLPVVVASVFLWLNRSKNSSRQIVAMLAIAWVSFYLLHALVNKAIVERKAHLDSWPQELNVRGHITTPTPFNTWLWCVVIEQDNGYFIGYRSVFDDYELASRDQSYQFFLKRDFLLEPLASREDVRLLKEFSQGYYTVSTKGDTINFNDLRFGQMIGWRDRQAPFVFHYYLNHPEANALLVQRGRFQGWDVGAVTSLWNRALGRSLNGRAPLDGPSSSLRMTRQIIDHGPLDGSRK